MATSSEVEALGFVLPGGSDLMSQGDDAIQLNAFAAAAGIIDAKLYKGNPGAVDVDTLKKTAVYAWGRPLPAGLTGLPDDATDALVLAVHGHDVGGWAAQDLYQYGRKPKRWWRISETTASWGPWQELNTTEQAMAANAAQQSQMIAATGGAVDTGGKGAFALRIDHGYNNYKTKLRDGLLSRGIVPGIATNSRNWGLAENNAVTLTEVDGWVAAGEIEILNHGATHGKSQANLHDEIVNGKTELETQLPSAKIYGFAPPGDSEWWGGFQGGKIGGWSDPAAGIILANHAYSLGYVGGARRVLDGTIRQALSHITLDKYDMTQARAQVDAAIAEGRGIQVMLHADWLDTTGNLTTADFLAFLDYVVAKRGAGDLVTLSPNQLILADSTRPPVTVPDVDGLAARLAVLDAKEDIEPAELGAEHLDTVTTPGDYYQSQSSEVTLAQGYPMELAGSLRVRANSERSQVQQFYTCYTTYAPGRFWRTYYAGLWSQWWRVADTYTPAAHTHPITDVDGLQAIIDQLTYDSGWRDVSSLLPAGLAKSTSNGRCNIKRKGDRLLVDMHLTVSADSVTTILTLPVEWRPDVPRLVPFSIYTAGAANHGLPPTAGLGYLGAGGASFATAKSLPNPGTVMLYADLIISRPLPTTLIGDPA